MLVVANIRGGGEYGEEWHHAGRLGTKQNCFDDFIACADHLVESGITSRDLLAIIGGSNGGLLMGAVLTQRPDLARAVVAAVPVMDSLRSETTMNGRYNTTEFGTVDDPEIFKALLDYSPYHNVRDGTDYPAVLLTAGEYDIRVDAWHAKKMTARLQAATASDRPVLLRLEAGGHLVRLARPDRRGDDRHLRLLVRPARPAGHARFRWLRCEERQRRASKPRSRSEGFEAQAWRPSHLNHRSVVGRSQSRSRRRSRNTVSRQMPSSLAIRGRTARVR